MAGRLDEHKDYRHLFCQRSNLFQYGLVPKTVNDETSTEIYATESTVRKRLRIISDKLFT
jgi:hypothetical protein